MKKSIKLAISLLICGLILLSGCSAASTSLPKNLAGQTFADLDTFNLLTPYFFTSQSENANEAKQQWLDEMSARYGVKINITAAEYKDGELDYDAFYKLDAVLNGRDTFGGMVYVSGFSQLYEAIKNGTAVPLEDYLADNPAWKALPEEIKSVYMVDGHVYAIPHSLNWNMNARSVYTDTLQQTGINITDLNSFKEYAIAVKDTGKYKFVLGSKYGMYLGDIFNAYGLYTDDNGNPFSYDPAEDCMVDFLTKGEAVAALEYLRDLYTAGVLKVYSSGSTSPYNDFTAGTCPTLYESYQLTGENYTQIETLNPAYPKLLECFVSGYIMTKDAPQPKETVNFFANMLFGSEQNYFDCWLGLSDKYVLNSDGSVTIKVTVNEDGEEDYSPSPNLVGVLPGVFPHSDRNFKYEAVGNVTSELAAAIEQPDHRASLNDAVKQGRALKVSPYYRQIHSAKFYAGEADFRALYATCIKDAITATNWTVQQIIDDYKEEMFKAGGNDMLDEMNAAIGKQTAYYYG